MTKLKQFINLLLTKKYITKFVAYFLLVIIFYVFSDFLGIFLLTFIFAYLFFTLAEYIKHKLDFILKKFPKNKKINDIIKKVFGLNLIIVALYIFFIGAIIFIVSGIVPKLVNELSELPKNIPFLAEPISGVTTKLVEIKNFNAELGGSITEIITNKDIDVVLDILSSLKSASVVFLQIIISIILSFVFLIDRFKLKKYLLKIKKSNFSFIYKEYKIILEKIVKSFGLIFKAQAMIAFVNSVLTIIGLIIIGLIHGGPFPYILTLGLIVFIAGFIPVLGVFISSIPIIIIAYSTIGGYPVILEVLVLIAIVHMVEAYYLNPKIVSKFLEIPVSLTFVILIVSEHLFGIAGLLIGVSLFYFIVGLLRDIDKVLKKNKKEIKRIKAGGKKIEQ
ncbi:MAG: AI-2E family transporter [Candidatus Gracilibacteria bacterium]